MLRRSIRLRPRRAAFPGARRSRRFTVQPIPPPNFFHAIRLADIEAT